MYPEIVMRHFLNPKNVGKIENPTLLGEFETPSKAKAIFYFKIENGIIKELKFQIAGCPYAIAVCSIITELATSKKVEEFNKFSRKELEKFFEIPEEKEDCINLSINAFLNGINKYKPI
jgi:nitrogen fixation NifU-like protein